MEPVSQTPKHIVGSAEPLNEQETRVRLQELEAWGVDLGLIRDSLARTPIERVRRMLDLLALANELRSHAANLKNNTLKKGRLSIL